MSRQVSNGNVRQRDFCRGQTLSGGFAHGLPVPKWVQFAVTATVIASAYVVFAYRYRKATSEEMDVGSQGTIICEMVGMK